MESYQRALLLQGHRQWMRLVLVQCKDFLNQKILRTDMNMMNPSVPHNLINDTI